MTQAATIALRAVALRAQVGDYAARKYAEHNGVLGLYRLALQLKGATK